MNEIDIYGVAKFVAYNSFFKTRDYTNFARAVLYLVKKYGTARGEEDTRDYALGEAITKKDEYFKSMLGCYFDGSDIAYLLYGNSELTEEQAQNRKAIKGELNV